MARLSLARKMIEEENEATEEHRALAWGDWRLWVWREIKYAVYLLALAVFAFLILHR
jgi:hypothetical protein